MESDALRSTGVNETALTVEAGESQIREKLDFISLYKLCVDDVYAFVCSMLKDRSTAEEVTAQAFERAYRKQGRFRPERGSSRAWIFGIARNAALDELRKRKSQELLVEEITEDRSIDIDSQIDFKIDFELVRAALAKVSQQEREIVALKFAGGLSNAEIAEVLKTSETNAGTLLYRAMQKLRKVCYEHL